jgi:Protein of unknown function (DUF3429)
MEIGPPPLSKTARAFGLAGLLPQLIAVLFLLDGSGMRWIATAGGFGYAALIFSFLGGMWWAIAMLNRNAPEWIYGAAIAPSLIALGTFLPWTWGWNWPGPSLLILAMCLFSSPLVDRAIARTLPLPDGWLALRWQLSLGLGALTAILAIAAFSEP